MEENNKLIAEFMGLSVIDMTTTCGCCGVELTVGDETRYDKNYVCYCDNNECSDGIATQGNILEPCWWDESAVDENSMIYHEDWNELMLVVEKIENLDIKFSVTIKKDHCTISNIFVYDPNIDINTHGENKLLFVYQAVVEFIKWYNINKS